jgi:hypothetical protein
LKRHSLDEENEDIQDEATEEVIQNEEVTVFSILATVNGLYILASLGLFSVLYKVLDSI